MHTMLAVARSAHADEDRCDAVEVVEGVIEHAHVKPGITLRADPPHSVPAVAAPRAGVAAALAPLVDNAVQHARSSVRITLRAERARVLVTVEDDGPGVAEELRDLIFEPGQTSRDGGAGLGLALGRRIAHSMGAEIHERGNGHGAFVRDLPSD